MQAAASIVMSLISPNTVVTAKLSGTKSSLDTPSFTQTFTEKISAAPPLTSKNPPPNPPVKVASAVRNNTMSSTPRAPKTIGKSTEPNNPEQIKIDATPSVQVALPPATIEIVPAQGSSPAVAEFPDAPPQVAQCLSNPEANAQASPQTATAPEAHTDVAHSVSSIQADPKPPVSPEVSVTIPASLPAVPIVPPLEPNRSEAQMPPASSSVQSEQPADPKIPTQTASTLRTADGPAMTGPELSALAPTLPEAKNPKHASVIQQHNQSSSPKLPEIVVATALTSIPPSATKLSNSAKSQPVPLPQKELPRAATQPLQDPIQSAELSSHSPSKTTAKSEPQPQTAEDKNTTAEPGTNKTTSVVGAATNNSSKLTEPVGTAQSQNGASSDSSQQKPQNNTARDDNADDPVAIERSPRENSSDSVQPISANLTGPAVSVAPANSATTIVQPDLTSNVVTAVPTQVVNDHSPQVIERAMLTGSPSDTPTSAPQGPNAPGFPGAPTVSNAQITGNTGQSEVHLAMQADKLGAVELHARVTGEQVGAAIVVDKKETHEVLAVELPALHQALSQKNFRVEHIWLTHSSLDATAGDPGNSSADQRSRPRFGSLPQTIEQMKEPLLFPPSLPADSNIFDDSGRLSVRA
jgi:hypothetical protein